MNRPQAALATIAAVRGLVGGPFGSSLVNKDYEHDGIPVIRGTNLNTGGMIGGEFVFVSEAKFERDLKRNAAEPGDLVFTQRGTLGQVAVVPSEPFSTYVVSQSQMRLRVDTSIADPIYVYFACRSKSFLQQIDDNAIATGVPHINLGILGRLTIPLPGLPEQQAIAEVLGALDDKIVANTKIASTADQFLAALFVRVTDDTSTLRLGDVATVNPESCKPVGGGSLRYIDISSVGKGNFEFPGISSWDEAPSRARRHVQRGDVLWSTVRPNRRSHALNLSNDPLLVGSTGLAILRPREVGFAYLYEATKTPDFTAYLENVAEGSAYPAVRASRFDEAPINWAPATEREAFEMMAAPLRKTLHSLDAENLHLASVRDALLPQLMSGKIRVKEAEEVVAGRV